MNLIKNKRYLVRMVRTDRLEEGLKYLEGCLFFTAVYLGSNDWKLEEFNTVFPNLVSRAKMVESRNYIKAIKAIGD